MGQEGKRNVTRGYAEKASQERPPPWCTFPSFTAMTKGTHPPKCMHVRAERQSLSTSLSYNEEEAGIPALKRLRCDRLSKVQHKFPHHHQLRYGRRNLLCSNFFPNTYPGRGNSSKSSSHKFPTFGQTALSCTSPSSPASGPLLNLQLFPRRKGLLPPIPIGLPSPGRRSWGLSLGPAQRELWAPVQWQPGFCFNSVALSS